MERVRRQLSLYVPRQSAAEIEAVRRIVDPIQSRLIPAHVTLCREDEFDLVESQVRKRLASAPLKPVTLSFGQAETFSGHGILMACVEGEDEFRRLREELLGSVGIRRQSPHITLAHPRNEKSPGNDLSATVPLPSAIRITFPTVRLIEQDGGEAWRVLETYELSG